MSYKKSDPQEYPTRVSHKSVLQECHLDICSFSNVFAFGFVGSILFFVGGVYPGYLWITGVWAGSGWFTDLGNRGVDTSNTLQ